MRSNLQNNLIVNPRLYGQQHGIVRFSLSGIFIIPTDGPNMYFLDPGVAPRTVYLPAISPAAGQQYYISNLGTRNLNIVDANGVSVGIVAPGDTIMFLSYIVGWQRAVQSVGASVSIQTVTGATGTILAGTDRLIINRTAPVTTNLTMPDAGGKAGKKLGIIDYSQSVTNHSIVLTPFTGSQKIMRQSTWTLNSTSDSLAAETFEAVVDPDDPTNYVWVYAP
jgi:hypothetical protein